MSTWRRKAIETLPDMTREFEHPKTTVYQVLFEMLARVEQLNLHTEEELQRIFDYALWCHTQRNYEIKNAVGVAFYEHLADEPITQEQIINRLPPNVFEDCKGLFELRLSSEEFRELCKRYYGKDEPPIIYPCPVCGHFVFDNPPGSFALCPICWWEDDIVQLGFPMMSGGANQPSLYEAQQEFLRSGAHDLIFIPHVRSPNESDQRDPDWYPFDPARDSHLDWESQRDTGLWRKADRKGSLYYWREDYWLTSHKKI